MFFTDKIGTTSKIIIGIIVVLVIVWLCYMLFKNKHMPEGSFKETYENMIVSAHRKYDQVFQDPVTLYNHTIGYENDKIAEAALKKSVRQEKLHTRNEKKNRLSPKHVNDATVSAFIAGNILRYNVAENTNSSNRYIVLNEVDQYYTRALERIHANPNMAIVERNPNRPRPERILDTIDTFYGGANNTVHETRNKLRRARIIESGHNSNVYFAPKHIRSDPQNVHDSSVVSDVLTKFNSIKLKNINESLDADSGPQIYEAIRSDRNLTPEQKERALKAAKSLLAGNHIESLHSDGREVLTSVWNRISSTENEGNRENLQRALMDSLVNSSERNASGEYRLVCLTGMCSRVLDSLTLLDSNPDISAPIKSTEILRNEIFSKAHKVMTDTVAAASPEHRAAYQSTHLDPDMSSRVTELETQICNNIDKIRDEYPNTDPRVLNTIIDDAKAGI